MSLNRFFFVSIIALSIGLLIAGLPASAQVETVLHSFQDGSVPGDIGNPYDAPLQGTDGRLYGTTGGPYYGEVFSISTTGNERVLYSFLGNGTGEPAYPWAPVIQATDGNFYGTSTTGGDLGGSELVY